VIVSAALLLLVLTALYRFFQVFDRPDLTVRRFAFLPVGLAAGAAYAAYRGWRAIRRFREPTPPTP
jgi:hypothetical protein